MRKRRRRKTERIRVAVLTFPVTDQVPSLFLGVGLHPRRFPVLSCCGGGHPPSSWTSRKEHLPLALGCQLLFPLCLRPLPKLCPILASERARVFQSSFFCFQPQSLFLSHIPPGEPSPMASAGLGDGHTTG